MKGERMRLGLSNPWNIFIVEKQTQVQVLEVQVARPRSTQGILLQAQESTEQHDTPQQPTTGQNQKRGGSISTAQTVTEMYEYMTDRACTSAGKMGHREAWALCYQMFTKKPRGS